MALTALAVLIAYAVAWAIDPEVLTDQPASWPKPIYVELGE